MQYRSKQYLRPNCYLEVYMDPLVLKCCRKYFSKAIIPVYKPIGTHGQQYKIQYGSL